MNILLIHGPNLHLLGQRQPEIVTIIGQHIDWADGILINPAAYTHTSVAIRDALATIGLPVIELHLSNVHGRESFRHHSYIAPIAMGTIAGFGAFSYDLAIEAMIQHLNVAQT